MKSPAMFLLSCLFAASPAFADDSPANDKKGSGTAWFLGGGIAEGTRFLQTGIPGNPLRASDTKTIHAIVEGRSSWFILSASGYKLRDQSGQIALTASVRGHLFAVGPVRTGLGFEYYNSLRETFQPPTIAYARIETEHKKQFGLGTLDMGIGRYDASYVRLLAVAGLSHTPTITEIYIFDQPRLVETQGSEKIAQFMYGGGAEFRLEPVNGLSLSGSAVHYRVQNNFSTVLPDEHTVFKGRVAYLSPFHMGIMIEGTHATHSQGIAFLNDRITASVGFTF